ncbi:MAG: DUF1641 domain-containing protein, partial [Planctomycetes bacterium]|nr:DUF1641 domain-containing protein [Planctomycetota bacterium]
DVAGARPVGAFGALRALSDPCVKRSLGALVEFGKRFGRTVHTRSGGGEPSPCPK